VNSSPVGRVASGGHSRIIIQTQEYTAWDIP
jgi:hypothetical protein